MTRDGTSLTLTNTCRSDPGSNKPIACKHCSGERVPKWRRGGKIILRVESDGTPAWACHYCGRVVQKIKQGEHRATGNKKVAKQKERDKQDLPNQDLDKLRKGIDMDSLKKGEYRACEFCDQYTLFSDELKVIALGLEGDVITQLAACSDCQRRSEDNGIIDRAREICLRRYGHTSAVEIAIVKQQG